MPHEEILGFRDETYSVWHRRDSIRRYVGIEKAQLLGMIDLDCSLWVEYDDKTKEPVGLIELARDNGQEYKPATVTKRLAERADVPALLVLYKPAQNPNPSRQDCPDIESFRIKRLHPDPEESWRILTPKEYAENLLKLRGWAAAQEDKAFQQKNVLSFEAIQTELGLKSEAQN